MSETHDNRGEILIDALLERNCTSSNLRVALAITVAESRVKLSAELCNQLFISQEVKNVPLSLAESDPEDLRLKVEALRMIFREIIVLIIAFANTQERDPRFWQRIKKITARYGIRVPWEENERDSIN